MTVRMVDFATTIKTVRQIAPQDVNASAQTGALTSLRNYPNGAFELSVGAHSGDAVAVTFKQAKNIDGEGAKALTNPPTIGYKNTVSDSPSDTWEQFTITNGTFNIAANTQYIIPVRHNMLDVSNNFDCIRMDIAAGSASTLVAASLKLWGGPQSVLPSGGDRNHMPSARLDREGSDV